MMISTKGRYALRMLADLAENQKDGYVALKDIAERQHISKKYLEQIIPLLSRANLLITTRGFQGGYRLAKTSDKYTVKEIIDAAEGGMAPVSCLEQPENMCPHSGECRTLPVWVGLHKVVNEYLEGVTLQSILEQKAGNDYMI